MPRIALPRGYPFPGARTKWQNPVPENFWDPKAWGVDGVYVDPPEFLEDGNARFQDDGVVFDDPLFVVDSVIGSRSAHVVTGVISQTRINIAPGLPAGLTFIRYKVGMKAQHTIQSLAEIIDEVHNYPLTLHWATLWTEVPFIEFNDDETGDVYTIDPPAGGRLQELYDEWEAAHPDSLEPNPWSTLTPRPET
jgi:hypothetical protein